MDFTAITNEIINNVSANQTLLEEYIRFKGALIELGKVGNAFTAELSNEELAFKENGQLHCLHFQSDTGDYQRGNSKQAVPRQ